MVQNGPKGGGGHNGVKTTPKRTRNDAKTMPKRSQSDPKMTPDRPQKWSKITLKWPYFGPKTVPKWPFMTQIGSNMAQKRSKRAKKNENPFKMHVDLHKSA